MKKLLPFAFNQRTYQAELDAFETLLESTSELSEKSQILPFFRQHEQVSSRIVLLSSALNTADVQAFEYDLFGDFAADLVVGDSRAGAYTFVEFEDARRNSVFAPRPGRFKSAFGTRFEHGYSQIVDWFYKLDSLQGTREMEERFGQREIYYEGILVIGRDESLNPTEQSRLKWRKERIVVNSKHILCYTFDQLLDILRRKEEGSQGIVLNE